MKVLAIFLVWVVLCIISLALYLVPTIVAFTRKHPNRVPIAIANVLLGWSVLGWVGALVWSFTATTPAKRN